jgi:hypothetical protein
MSTAKFDTLSTLDGSQSVPVNTVAQGSAKAWVNFDGTGTVAIRAAFNVSSITDNAVGQYTVNFTTAMPDRNYSVTQCAGNPAANACYLTSFFVPTTGSVGLLCRSDAAVTIDAAECNIAVFR